MPLCDAQSGAELVDTEAYAGGGLADHRRRSTKEDGDISIKSIRLALKASARKDTLEQVQSRLCLTRNLVGRIVQAECPYGGGKVHILLS